ncbi:homeobox domain-containing protein [Streptomyces yaizuensis]|uniref:DNA-binding protein n=1 Tax=Streptomyces yaizuensis TaxID=2989713 RepID=A0ABQ5PBH3_9ACTN|nr:homeobox domain-containing protein [Streptomyces sp. YSPA8]GLF99917.1 hypothetical protein SYYSPA8_36490 [Streptomyces sp. YSPA8]
MTSTDALQKAFADLPDQITRTEIAAAAGLTETGVQNWFDAYPDFPPVVGKGGRFHLRDRDLVLAWLLGHPELLDSHRRGPKDLTERARSARPSNPVDEFLTVKETAQALGVSREAVQYYIASSAPGTTSDPFPPAIRQGRASLRSWPAVRSWVLRRADPLPGGNVSWEQLRPWLLAVHEQEKDEPDQGHDDKGLTYAQRDVLERARVATANGYQVPAEWTAEALGLDTLPVDEPDAAPKRLALTDLARELETSSGSLRGYVRRYPPGVRDPFPAADARGTRNVEDVRAWLRRSGPLAP